jgi:SET family sugar efflux transporter-like MFS transporter
MAAPTLTPVRLTRRLLPLALIFIAVGLSTSFVYPYLALFLNDAVHAGPLKTTAFLVVAPLSGVLMSWLIGRLSDRRPIRHRLLIAAALAGIAGTALTAVVRDYWVLLAITVTLTAIAGSLFPQSFAYARQVLEHGDPGRAPMAISLLRMLFSIAWVGGPPLAAFILAARGFTEIYAFAAAMYAVAFIVIVLGLREVPSRTVVAGAHHTPATPAPRRTIYLVIIGFAVVQVTMTLGVQAMPLFITNDLGGSIRDTGMILGLCAALEIPFMIGFGALSTRMPQRRLILSGVLAAIAYQAVTVTATTVWVLAAAQVLNAAFIAAVTGLGISYVQDLMPGQPGRATTMVTNTFPIGGVLAAPAFGLAQHFGFRLAYGLNLALCVLGLLLLIVAGGRRLVSRPEVLMSEHG